MSKNTIFDDVLVAATNIPDGALRLEFLTSFIRACLIHAAVGLTEYLYEETDLQGYPRVFDNARRLLVPSDGDLVVALDDLLPVAYESGWRGCAIQWFDGSPKTEPLRARLRRWIEFRNNRQGHGVVAQNVIEDALPWLSELALATLRVLQDLLPASTGKDKLRLVYPTGEVELQSLRLNNGIPLLLRKIQRRGSAWRVHAQTLSHKSSSEIHYPVLFAAHMVSLRGSPSGTGWRSVSRASAEHRAG